MRAKVCIRGRDAELGMFAARHFVVVWGVDGGWSVGLAGKLRMEKSTPRKSCRGFGSLEVNAAPKISAPALHVAASGERVASSCVQA